MSNYSHTVANSMSKTSSEEHITYVVEDNKATPFKARAEIYSGYNLGGYNPESDPYYAKTAYTEKKPHVSRYYQDPNTDYPKNNYKRFDWWPPVTGEDLIGMADPVSIYNTRPMENDGKILMKWSPSILKRISQSYEKEFFRSKYNYAPSVYFFGLLFYVFFKFGWLMILGFIILSFMSGDFQNWESTMSDVYFILAYYPCVYVGWKFFIWLGNKIPDKKHRTLNRRTGMVCIPQRGKKPDIELPFAEFEPRIRVTSSPTGFNHHLVYVHKSGTPVFFAGGRYYADTFLKAAYFEQFMDITKPLPDLPNLEWCRDKDPTTCAYDKATNRAPHYWRNKSLTEIKEIGRTRREELRKLFGKSAYKV